jgi:superfamily II RNA helicase
VAHGYAEADGRLTADGVWASQLRVDQPLLIAEGFRRQAFPEGDPALLAGIVAAFVNEDETDDALGRKMVPRPLAQAYNRVRKRLVTFARDMHAGGFPVRPLHLRPAATLYHWASGLDWEQVVRLAELEEGNLAMLVLRTADNLRHIRALGEVFPTAAEAAGAAVEAILRDPVLTEL